MKYAKIRERDVANGPGVRVSLFVSGCTFKCKGCFNEIAQDFNYGKEFTKEIEDLIIQHLKDENIVGINILGGEPMQQDSKTILNLVKRIKKETGKNIWMWSGFLFEDLIKNQEKLEILNYIDILVDGRFKLEQRDIKLKYRGSSNQRVIDVQKSLKSKSVIKLN